METLNPRVCGTYRPRAMLVCIVDSAEHAESLLPTCQTGHDKILTETPERKSNTRRFVLWNISSSRSDPRLHNNWAVKFRLLYLPDLYASSLPNVFRFHNA